MKQLRQTILAQEDIIAAKQRHGLFSQPAPLAIGDDSNFKILQAQKGEDGKPLTKPRNMLGGINRTGKLKKSYLNYPSSIYEKDPYQDTFQKELKYQNKMHSKGQMHELDFKPASGFKDLKASSYKYVEQKQQGGKKNRKGGDGRVMTEPAQVYTNGTSTVERKLMKFPQYKVDPYQRSSQIVKQQKQQWRKKVIHQTMFKTSAHGGEPFSKIKQQYGIDDKVKSIMACKKPNVDKGLQNMLHHDARFKLAAKSNGDPIARYPEFIPPKAKTEASQQIEIKKAKRMQNKEKDEKERWKPSSGNLTRPTPSISLNHKNLKRKY